MRVTKNNIQIVVCRLGWKWIDMSVPQLLLLKQKEVELLYYKLHYITFNYNRQEIIFEMYTQIN